MTHGRPEQQSAVEVQAPVAATHAARHLFPTQGLPQQSALVAQLVPAGTGVLQVLAWSRQRGMPSASLRQQLSGLLLQYDAFGASSGSQQLFSDEQDDVLGLQIEPASRHAMPLSQRPNSCVGVAFAHVTGPFTGAGAPDQPQQSLSFRQISPVGAQPDSTWQTRKPGPAPVAAQTREQQVPPHAGTGSVDFAQTVPFTEHSVAPGALTVSPHAPSSAPAAITQLPPQQSAFFAQASPFWMQNDTEVAEQ